MIAGKFPSESSVDPSPIQPLIILLSPIPRAFCIAISPNSSFVGDRLQHS
ncbi:hypothetical protein D082_50190 (plasmid) [Synechocystis sp. PCC 6714]|nr:hypothetical protein D082_50190 [Synechocystis sp. PCC 6714]